MFYRIRNHIFNLNEVIDIRAENTYIVIETKENHQYIIPVDGINVSALMDKIQNDLATNRYVKSS